MMLNRCLERVAAWVVAVSLCATAFGQNEKAESRAEPTKEEFIRRVETPGKHVALEIVSKTYVPSGEGSGPKVGLIGVSHIGDGAFYRSVQDVLDQYEIVLYEAIRPSGTGGAHGETTEEQIESTRRAMKFIASAVEAHREVRQRYPGTIDELRAFTREIDPIIVNWLTAAAVDAWGRPLGFSVNEEGTEFSLKSLGADGKPGGDEGTADADLILTQADAVAPLAMERDNIQKQLATALGLSYQLEALTYDAANWRPSDMTVEQLSQAFQARGMDMGPLAGAMGGAGFPAQVGRLLLRMIGMLDAMMEGAISDIAKIMMIEVLGDDRLLEQGMGQLGQGFTEIILYERNQVVIDDLKRLLQQEPDVKSVAILYGAAHLPDLEERLYEQLQYEPQAETWLTAISVNLQESRVSAAQLAQMRQMMRRAMQQQSAPRRR
ncbi:MAG TPA: type II secretion system protein GspG [Phycisphaerales bacterium]|nr:type II secretion system protein GspG [Phycisphaerales bacterium]